jgi:hypothetical protein
VRFSVSAARFLSWNMEINSVVRTGRLISLIFPLSSRASGV